MSEAERIIDRTVARLARGRHAPDEARAELKDHLLEAANARAKGREPTADDVQAALRALGGEAAVQATFFPRASRPRVGWPPLAVLLGVVVACAILIVLTRGGYVPCVAAEGAACAGGGESGFSDDAMLVLAPPVLVLLAMLLLPAWVAPLVAAPYAALMLVWLVQDPGAQAVDVAIALGGAVTFGVALHHLWRAKAAAPGAEPGVLDGSA